MGYTSFIATCSLMVALPLIASADHMPSQSAQDFDPDYIQCVSVADQATLQFRTTLQASCLSRLTDICSVGSGDVPVPEQLECLQYEQQQIMGFLVAALVSLPEDTPLKGFAQRGYDRDLQRLRTSVLQQHSLSATDDLDVTVQRMVTAGTDLIQLFWLARRAEVSVQNHVIDSRNGHQ